MQFIKTILLTFALALALPAAAQEFEAGMKAYERGDYAAALRDLRPLAEKGTVRAQTKIAYMYLVGHGVTQNRAVAVRWYRKAADQGDARAQLHLGSAYTDGRGVARNEAEGLRWILLSAEQGYLPAFYQLGNMYFYGFHVPRDFVQAHMWWSLAADQGYRGAASDRDAVASKMIQAQIAEAQRLAREWRNEPGGRTANSAAGESPQGFEAVDATPESAAGNAELQRGEYSVALSKFWAMAERVNAEAQTVLGYMYAEGLGVARDPEEAVKWYRMAAKQGIAEAQNNLGKLYENGDGVAQDYIEALKWYRMAAEQGLALAQHNLGVMYAKGDGVDQDNELAYVWYSLAVGQGHQDARQGLEYVAGKLTAEQIVEAEKRAREWRTK